MRAIKKFFMTIVLILIVALAIIIAGGWGKYTQAVKMTYISKKRLTIFFNFSIRI